MTERKVFDCPKMVETALRGVVRQTLLQIGRSRVILEEHSFYISFCTGAAGVALPDHLLAKYPEEMTVVLQFQFWDLDVREDEFSVTLHFDSKPERLTIPFAAITSFADPSVSFGLQFTPPAAAQPEPARVAGEVISLDEFRQGRRPVNDGPFDQGSGGVMKDDGDEER